MSAPRLLVACECSGVVRRAFQAAGWEAWSCDLKPAEDGSPWHIRGDAIRAAYGQPWDMLIGHPTCRYLTNSGAKHLYLGGRAENGPDPVRWARMGAGAAFFLALWNAPVPRVCIENPVMVGHAKRLFGIPKQSMSFQPWEHGHGEVKRTCLWLRGLPRLQPSDVVEGREPRVHRMAPGPQREADRSRTYEGVARAMATQWGADGTLFARVAA